MVRGGWVAGQAGGRAQGCGSRRASGGRAGGCECFGRSGALLQRATVL
jgi:hypothetical protein